jgi:hypothetical protein
MVGPALHPFYQSFIAGNIKKSHKARRIGRISHSKELFLHNKLAHQYHSVSRYIVLMQRPLVWLKVMYVFSTSFIPSNAAEFQGTKPD